MAAGAPPRTPEAIDPAEILKLGRTRWFAVACALLMIISLASAVYHALSDEQRHIEHDIVDHDVSKPVPMVDLGVPALASRAVLADLQMQGAQFAGRFFSEGAKRKDLAAQAQDSLRFSLALHGADGRPGWTILTKTSAKEAAELRAALKAAGRSEGQVLAAGGAPVFAAIHRKTIFPARGKEPLRSWRRDLTLAVVMTLDAKRIEPLLADAGLPAASSEAVVQRFREQAGLEPPAKPAEENTSQAAENESGDRSLPPMPQSRGSKTIWQILTDLPWVTFAAAVLCLGLAVAQWRHVSNQFRRTEGLVGQIEADAYDRAMRDPLTGLHNRSGFKTRLDQAIANRGETSLLGVIYIDLDRFKEVNDSYGHDMGDKLLVAVTERLKTLCLKRETVARLGGDEFAMVVEGHDTAASIEELGATISLELGKPFILTGTRVDIGGSVGVAVAPDDGASAQELVRRADISMYRSKAAGRGQSHRFHSSMEDEVRRRAFLESELRFAIERQELDVFYQPVMASDGETLIGCEALIRWIHHK